jgi:hypothetical protein
MATVAITEDRARRPIPARSVIVALSSASAAALFIAMRFGIEQPYPIFQGACERLADAGIGPWPLDWFCQPVPWSARVATIVAPLLLAAGFVIPAMVLAATGRRVTAFLPLLAAPTLAVTGAFAQVTWWAAGTWPGRAVPATAATMLVMAMPVLAVAFATREEPRKQPPIALAVSALTWLLLLLPIAAIAWITRGSFLDHWAPIGGTIGPIGLQPGAVAVMVLFGALMGPDRRYWPWSLAFAAILLSAGPSIVVAPSPWRLIDWSQFGVAVPLMLVGLVASAWRPIAVWLTEHVGRPARPVPIVVAGAPSGDRSLRPAVALNAVAVALLFLSAVAFRVDPLPGQLATPMPTFSGLRTVASELQARSALHDAMHMMTGYRNAHGSFAGFQPPASDVGTELLWVRHLSMDEAFPQITIDSASRERARVVALTDMGSVVCLERHGSALTYGSARGSLTTIGRTVEAAIAACGDSRWTQAALAPLDVRGLCDGLDPYTGYDICRMVEVELTKRLGADLTI